MRERCLDNNCRRYKDYGGRGIKICQRWDKYENFLAEMGRKPGPEYSIDRIDNNGNYEPKNCRWATNMQQRRNRRDAIQRIMHNGQPLCVPELAIALDIKYATLKDRLYRGWKHEELVRPVRGTTGSAVSYRKRNAD